MTVALCEEGVDRNELGDTVIQGGNVALCEEGVDRNIQEIAATYEYEGRPLRRGRG